MRAHIWRTYWPVAGACIIALLFVGCDSAEPVGPESPKEPVPALRLEARSDTALTGLVGSRVLSVPVVRLTLDGHPAPGREIRFLVSGGGSVELASQRTDTAGLASPGAWTLGTAARPQTLTARVAGTADLVFTAVGKAQGPATMEIVAGSHQTAAAGASLPIPLQVKLADLYGNPVSEVPVTYTIIAGTGVILGASVQTDSLGFASSGVWTLGSAGPQLVKASAAGKEAVFDAFACDDPCHGRDLLFTRGGDLYFMVDGVTTPLFTGASDPAWSPDGQNIAFDVDDWSDGASLYLMNADGSGAALRAAGFSHPSWSPDGRQLAVSGAGGIYTLSVEENGAPPVLLAEAGWDPAWSPDGTKIAFVDWRDEDFSLVASLKVMNADGSGVTTLLQGDTLGMSHPTWSPDGRRLAFASCGPRGCNVFAVSAGGADLVQLTTANDAFNPTWSPDGSRIAFASASGIVWVPADGSTSTPITMIPGGDKIAWRP